MDGETPSWLDEGASSTPAAAPTPAPSSAPDASAAPPPAFSIDETAPPSAKTATAPTDNVAGSILANMNATADAKTAPTSNEEDEKDLPKMILFMRVLNMAAATLLMTCSVSEPTTVNYLIFCIRYVISYFVNKSCNVKKNLFLDYQTGGSTPHISLGNSNLRNLRWFANMLP